MIPQSRFQPAEMAAAAADVPRLKFKWAFGFPGATFAFAQPTVIGGRVFIGSQAGKLYSLDVSTGCTYWEFDAGAGCAAVPLGPTSAGWTAYVGDRRGNLHAVDAVTGKALWTTQVDDHPAARITGAPTLVGTTLYVPVSSTEKRWPPIRNIPAAASAAALLALEASTGGRCGRVTPVAEEPRPGAMSSAGVQLMVPSGAAVWSSPTFDAAKDMLDVTTGDNYSDSPTGMSDAIRRSTLHPGAGVVAADHVRRRLQRGVSGDGPELPRGRGRISISARWRSWSALRMENAR